MTKIGKILKSDSFKMPTQSSLEKNPSRSEAVSKLEESAKRNPYLPLPPPPLMPHPDEVRVNEKEEDKEGKKEENQEENDMKEDEKEGRTDIFERDDCNREDSGGDGEDFNEEDDDQEFVDGNISDWLDY